MLIIQFHTSNVWENATHSIFIQFQKKIFLGKLKLPQNLFFFSTANRILYSNKHFPKFFFLHANFIFLSVKHMDTQILDFF